MSNCWVLTGKTRQMGLFSLAKETECINKGSVGNWGGKHQGERERKHYAKEQCQNNNLGYKRKKLVWKPYKRILKDHTWKDLQDSRPYASLIYIWVLFKGLESRQHQHSNSVELSEIVDRHSEIRLFISVCLTKTSNTTSVGGIPRKAEYLPENWSVSLERKCISFFHLYHFDMYCWGILLITVVWKTTEYTTS